MGFRRIVFEQVGGFNVLLGAGTKLKCAEDTELIARASAVGLAGGYFPEPTVSHHHGRKEADADALMRGYDIGRGAFFVAMARHRSVRIQYLKRWYWSLAWNRKARFLRELGGACRFIGSSLTAAIAQRNPVPRPLTPAATRQSAST
jgi:GT2 family glycosyltransferase